MTERAEPIPHESQAAALIRRVNDSDILDRDQCNDLLIGAIADGLVAECLQASVAALEVDQDPDAWARELHNAFARIGEIRHRKAWDDATSAVETWRAKGCPLTHPIRGGFAYTPPTINEAPHG